MDRSACWSGVRPEDRALPDRDGFGRYVIERMVGQSLGGRVSIEFPPEGIRWRLETPLSHLVTAGHVSSS
jgi:two-component sensor histidine kinase